MSADPLKSFCSAVSMSTIRVFVPDLVGVISAVMLALPCGGISPLKYKSVISVRVWGVDEI